MSILAETFNDGSLAFSGGQELPGLQGDWSKPAATIADLVDVYRFVNSDGHYAYTSRLSGVKGAAEYEFDGSFQSAFRAYARDLDGPGLNVLPVYELRHDSQQWIYTQEKSRIDFLTGLGYMNQGIAFYADRAFEQFLFNRSSGALTQVSDGAYRAEDLGFSFMANNDLEAAYKRINPSAKQTFSGTALLIDSYDQVLREVDLVIKETSQYVYQATIDSRDKNLFFQQAADAPAPDVARILFQVTQRIEDASKASSKRPELFWANYLNMNVDLGDDQYPYYGPVINFKASKGSEQYARMDSLVNSVRSASGSSSVFSRQIEIDQSQAWIGGALPDQKLDIRGIDLSGYQIKKRKFANADMRDARYSYAITPSVYDSVYENVNLDGADLTGSNMIMLNDSTARGVTAKNASFNAVNRTDFAGSILSDTYWTNSEANAITDSDLTRAVLDNRNFANRFNDLNGSTVSSLNIKTDIDLDAILALVGQILNGDVKDALSPIAAFTDNVHDSYSIKVSDTGFKPSKIAVDPQTDHHLLVINFSLQMFGITLMGPEENLFFEKTKPWGVAGKIETAGKLGEWILKVFADTGPVYEQIQGWVKDKLEAADRELGTQFAPQIGTLLAQLTDQFSTDKTNHLLNDVYSIVYDFDTQQLWNIKANNYTFDSSLYVNNGGGPDSGTVGPVSWDWAGNDNDMKNWRVTYRA